MINERTGVDRDEDLEEDEEDDLEKDEEDDLEEDEEELQGDLDLSSSLWSPSSSGSSRGQVIGGVVWNWER